MHSFLLMLSLSSFTMQQVLAQWPTPQAVIATHYQLPGADCALFPAAARVAGTFSAPEPTEYFTPTKEQVAAIEKNLLPAHLRLLAAKAPYGGDPYWKNTERIYKNLATFRRQYVGFYNKQRQPCLYINCFPKKRDDSRWLRHSPSPVLRRAALANQNDMQWLQYLVMVEDGGANYWSIYFNLATKQFFDFGYNSIA